MCRNLLDLIQIRIMKKSQIACWGPGTWFDFDHQSPANDGKGNQSCNILKKNHIYTYHKPVSVTDIFKFSENLYQYINLVWVLLLRFCDILGLWNGRVTVPRPHIGTGIQISLEIYDLDQLSSNSLTFNHVVAGKLLKRSYICFHQKKGVVTLLEPRFPDIGNIIFIAIILNRQSLYTCLICCSWTIFL